MLTVMSIFVLHTKMDANRFKNTGKSEVALVRELPRHARRSFKADFRSTKVALKIYEGGVKVNH